MKVLVSLKSSYDKERKHENSTDKETTDHRSPVRVEDPDWCEDDCNEGGSFGRFLHNLKRVQTFERQDVGRSLLKRKFAESTNSVRVTY